jgi:hypothetical protein
VAAAFAAATAAAAAATAIAIVAASQWFSAPLRLRSLVIGARRRPPLQTLCLLLRAPWRLDVPQTSVPCMSAALL